MFSNLFVSNLPQSTNERHLREVFSRYGQVLSVKIILDRNTGKSRGFGFVKVDSNDAENVVQHLNGYSFKGNRLSVKYDFKDQDQINFNQY